MTTKLENDNNIGILLISDLHFVDSEYNDHEKSLIQSKTTLLPKMINKIKEQEVESNYKCKYIILVGDSSDSGLESEFQMSSEFMNKLSNELGIKKDNIMIIPGNHDFDISAFRNFIMEKRKDDPNIDYHQFNSKKFDEFKKYYDDFFSDSKKPKKFCPDKVIVDVLNIRGSGLLFIGINTAYGESWKTEDHTGYIDTDRLDEELSVILGQYKTSKRIVIVMHHPTGESSTNKIINWPLAREVFKKYDIEWFISGDIHTAEGAEVTTGDGTVGYLICGSLGAPPQKPLELSNSFIMLISKDNPITEFVNATFTYIEDYKAEKNSRFIVENNNSNIIKNIPIQDKIANTKKQSISAFDTFKASARPNMPSASEIDKKETLEKGTEYIVRTIKDNKLYVSGHFHWGPQAKSLTYLRTDYFFENIDDLERVITSLKKIIGSNRPDLVIGYEMNGSILGSLIATDLSTSFTYMTADNRNYTPREYQLPTGKYKSIMIIVDFLYTNNLIKSIEDRVKKTYKNVSTIDVYALFKGKIINPKNRDESSKKYDGISNINYVYEIPMLNCNQDKGSCPIHNKGLTDTTEFYVENE